MAYDVKTARLASGVRMPYVEQGEALGVPVVLLHGFAGTWRSFQRLLPCLPESFHTLALTQRGHGEAGHPDTGFRPGDFAADVAAFLDDLHIQAAVIVGHSMGSGVAQRFAIDYPERVLGLVLVSPRAKMSERPGLQELYETTISKLTDPVDPAFVRSFMDGVFVRPVPEAYFKQAIEDAMKVPAHVWKRAFKTAMEEDLVRDLDAIDVPTLLIWGAEDASVPEADREAIAEAMAGARQMVYPGVGHGPHAEVPERFAGDLTAFVEEEVRVGDG